MTLTVMGTVTVPLSLLSRSSYSAASARLTLVMCRTQTSVDWWRSKEPPSNSAEPFLVHCIFGRGVPDKYVNKQLRTSRKKAPKSQKRYSGLEDNIVILTMSIPILNNEFTTWPFSKYSIKAGSQRFTQRFTLHKNAIIPLNNNHKYDWEKTAAWPTYQYKQDRHIEMILYIPWLLLE